MNGIVIVYVQDTTMTVMMRENGAYSVQTDVVNFIRKLIPEGIWLHD